MTRRPPTPDELDLFGRVMSDTTPLKRRRRGTAKPAEAPPPAPVAAAPSEPPVLYPLRRCRLQESLQLRQH
jgi:hypothetical protein